MFNEDGVYAYEVMASRPATARPEERVFEVTQRMLRGKHRALPVVDERQHLLGIITERDCVKALINAVHHRLPPSSVQEVMTRDVVTVRRDASLMAVAGVFHHHPVSVLPVMDGPRCVGMLTRAQCLRRAVKVFRSSSSRNAAILYLSALGRRAPV